MRRPGPVDPDTRQNVENLMTLARNRGLDRVDVLNRAGFLLTPQREKQIRVDTLEGVIHQLREIRPPDLIRASKVKMETAHPADMYIAILQWLENFRISVEDGNR